MEESTLAEWRQLSSAKGFRPQKKDRKRMRVRSGFPGASRHAQNNVIDESAELDNAVVLSMNQSGLSKYTMQEEGTKRISMLQEMKETFQESKDSQRSKTTRKEDIDALLDSMQDARYQG